MLKKIKSTFILKSIFLYIEDKRKLNFIKYNKNMQRKLKFNLVDYQRYSGLLKLEEDNKIKIYNNYTHKKLFEGYFGNGKRNGIGKEYNEEGNVIFDGEYKENQKWKGYEKVYDEDTGNLILFCEYKDGKKEGKIEEYDKITGKLLFKGNYLNGKRNGEGEEYKLIFKEKDNNNNYYHLSNDNNFKIITIFSGEYLNGERIKGKEYNYDEKLIYEGEYLNGKKNGKGKTYDKN